MRPVRRLHPVPLAVGIAVALLTLQLGNWQTRRAAEKTALQAEFAAAQRSAPQALGAGDPAEWQTVEVRGEWLAERVILLDNRVHQGRAGYHVYMPFKAEGRDRGILVNRGWIAAAGDRSQLPAVHTHAGPVQIVGRVRRFPADPFTLAADAGGPTGRVWQTVDPKRYGAWSGFAVEDFYLQQTSAAADGLVRDWPAPDAGVDRHRGYAFQWYALAALALALTLIYLWKTLRSPLGERLDRC